MRKGGFDGKITGSSEEEAVQTASGSEETPPRRTGDGGVQNQPRGKGKSRKGRKS